MPFLPITSELPVQAESEAPRPSAALERSERVKSVRRDGARSIADAPSARDAMRRWLHGVKWQSVILVAALVDISVLCVELGGSGGTVEDSLTALVLLIFLVDITLRLYAYQLLFFRRAWNYVDLVVLLASCVLYILGVAAEVENEGTTDSGAEESNVYSGASTAISVTRGSRALRGLLTAVRVMRAIRVARTFVNAGKGTQRAARYMTGENKKRFVDLKNNFDLDLVYIQPELIAMSVPATGMMALYRNPLNEVVRFLETRHAKGGYTVFNCCPEHPYPSRRFVSGNVELFDIQDHTPPTMDQFVTFLNKVRTMPPGRIVVVHCRGGKGRTGSLCCAWLLYQGICEDADDALNMFALERTELSLGKKKLQGVDTPSQRRYIQYVHVLLSTHGAYLNGVPNPSETTVDATAATQQLGKADELTNSCCIVPFAPQCPVFLRSLTLHSWYTRDPAGPLICAVHVEAEELPGGSVIFWSSPIHPPFTPSSHTNVASANVHQASNPNKQAVARFDLNGLEVRGDVRISVFSLDDLHQAQAKRVKQGLPSKFDFDATSSGPSPAVWQHAPAVSRQLSPKTTLPSRCPQQQSNGIKNVKSWKSVRKIVSSHSMDRSALKRVIAGKEPGCKFYFLFHTGFVGNSGRLDVPLLMMDKAFKNKHNKYNTSGFARLEYDAPGYNGLELKQLASDTFA